MKTKDIKTLLNKETGENTPDVLDNVKVSPINKLKNNEKSLVAFKKTMATLILVFLLVIVVVLSVAIHGYTTQVRETTKSNMTFMSLRLASSPEDTPTKAYNFIIDGTGRIILAFDEMKGDTLHTPTNFEDILDLLEYNGEGTIFIVASSDRPAFAKQFGVYMAETIEKDDNFDGVKIISHVNETVSRNTFENAISVLPSDEKVDYGTKNINELCALYSTLIEELD